MQPLGLYISSEIINDPDTIISVSDNGEAIYTLNGISYRDSQKCLDKISLVEVELA